MNPLKPVLVFLAVLGIIAVIDAPESRSVSRYDRRASDGDQPRKKRRKRREPPPRVPPIKDDDDDDDDNDDDGKGGDDDDAQG